MGNTVDKKTIDDLCAEYSRCGSSSPDAELRLVDAALFVEDCFGLRVLDEEITPANLGDTDSLRGFLRGKMGV
jgi:hypothetical protein